MTISLSESLKDIRLNRLDLLIAAIGYETRARHVLEKFQNLRIDHIIAFSFTERHEFEFNNNYNCFLKRNAQIVDADVSLVERIISEYLIAAKEKGLRKLSIGLDISSMSRELIAECFAIIHDGSLKQSITTSLSILYSPAVYCEPPKGSSPVTVMRPVSNRFAGWTTKPDAPMVCVVGLGYENSRALGAIEIADASENWFFYPHGIDSDYETSLDLVNEDLLLSYANSDNTIKYDVKSPYDLFINMRSLFIGILRDKRLTVFPFGPKIFFAVALILSVMLGKEISIWRISGEQLEVAFDRKPTGEIVTFNILISAKS